MWVQSDPQGLHRLKGNAVSSETLLVGHQPELQPSREGTHSFASILSDPATTSRSLATKDATGPTTFFAAPSSGLGTSTLSTPT
jgi:hypothetical protein